MSVGEEVKNVGGKEVVRGNEEKKLLFMFSVPIFSKFSIFFEKKDSTAVRKIKETNEKSKKTVVRGKGGGKK